MKIKSSKPIILYLLIILIGLISVGLIGAIIRLINIPAIIITVILIGGLGYYKKIGWFQTLISSKFQNKNERNLLDLSLTSKKQAAGKSLKSIDNLITLINDEVEAKALKEEKNRVSLELDRGQGRLSSYMST